MGPTTIRAAAVLGAVALFTTLGGAAISSADPGSSRSPSGHAGHQSHGGGDGPRDRRQTDQRRGSGQGAGGNDRQTSVASRTSSDAEPATTARVAAVAPVAQSDAPVIAIVPAATGGGGSSVTGQPTAPLVVPRVTFGNGRSPRAVAAAPDDLPLPVRETPALAIVVPSTPAPAPPQPVAPSALTVAVAPWPLPDIPVASVLGEAERGWPADALFGLAGLLLAPIAGAWLGYRQARASRSASELVSR